MTTATPASPATAFDHLLRAIPEPASLRQSSPEGRDLQGILALLGVDMAAKTRLQAVLAVSRFLEALDALDIHDITVDEARVDTGEDLFHITWNRDIQNPALTLDGTLTDENEILSLWGRRSLSAGRAAVNGVEIEAGLGLQAEIDGDLDLLHLSFVFEASEKTPGITLRGSLPVMGLLRELHA